jgi:uncharacterized surface protein with fasciclin (FAS1) repeats
MKSLRLNLIALIVGSALSVQAQNVMVGGEQMYPQKDIVDNAIHSKDHTTLVAAVKTAELVETLKSSGPFTVFAPTNDAFENLPDGTVANLLKPANKKDLVGILTYHVIAGNYTYNDLKSLIKKGKEKAVLSTVNGASLTFKMNGSVSIQITDNKGSVSNIFIYDVAQSNGVIHSIDSVLLQ